MHAVHAVEDVLVKLVDRGCNLQIAWFDSHEKLCAPPQTHKEALYKYTVSREILIEHLRQAGHPRQAGHLRLAGMSHRFPSPDSKQFEEYVADNAVQCVLCTGPLVPATSRDNVRLELQAFMYRISSMGCSVAMLSELKFVSSKVGTCRSASLVTRCHLIISCSTTLCVFRLPLLSLLRRGSWLLLRSVRRMHGATPPFSNNNASLKSETGCRRGSTFRSPLSTPS